MFAGDLAIIPTSLPRLIQSAGTPCALLWLAGMAAVVVTSWQPPPPSPLRTI